MSHGEVLYLAMAIGGVVAFAIALAWVSRNGGRG